MKRIIHTETTIHAEPEKVWSILTDFKQYDTWNPFIPFVVGEPCLNARLRIYLEPPGGKRQMFRPVIVRLVPNQELIWLGKLGIAGLFHGEHRFLLRKAFDGSTHFIQEELFSGLLVPFLGQSVADRICKGFNEMNTALKKKAEFNIK